MDLFWKLTSLLLRIVNFNLFIQISIFSKFHHYLHTSQLIVIITKTLFQMILIKSDVSSASSKTYIVYIYSIYFLISWPLIYSCLLTPITRYTSWRHAPPPLHFHKCIESATQVWLLIWCSSIILKVLFYYWNSDSIWFPDRHQYVKTDLILELGSKFLAILP